MQIIEIKSTEWTIEGFRALWADDATLTPAQVDACADAQYAYLVLSVRDHMRGWNFGPEGFTGPARADAISEIMNIVTKAVDYVIAHLAEIKAEAAYFA